MFELISTSVFCAWCGSWLDASKFARNARLPSGRQAHCRQCSNARNRAWYAQRRGAVRTYAAPPPSEYLTSRAGITAMMAAKRFGVSWSVVRRWDRETGFVSPRAERRRCSDALPRLSKAGVDAELLHLAIAALSCRSVA